MMTFETKAPPKPDPNAGGTAETDPQAPAAPVAHAMDGSADSLGSERESGIGASVDRSPDPAGTEGAGADEASDETAAEAVLEARAVDIFYGGFQAIEQCDLRIEKHRITALIGPSGCGKSTMLRAFNRMNDLVPACRLEGRILYHGQDIYAPKVDPVSVRRRIGMVFQKPNPFPKSIFENVVWGAKVNGFRGDLHELAEVSLRQAALWDEVKDQLDSSGLSLSGGQQQRLCIARTLAVKPDVILMDEPCSALDPLATLRIEELMQDLKESYTIVIVTHNMQQAARASDFTAFFNMGERRQGYLVEYGPTDDLFTNPKNTMTEDYITGRFG